MDEFLSKLIPLIFVFIVVSNIINKSKKNQAKKTGTSASSYTPAQSTQNKSLSLQEIIRQQIEEQKKAVSQLQPQNVAPIKTEMPKPAADDGSLEMKRHSHDVHEGGAYNEGDPLNRGTLEGVQTEMQRHAERLKLKDERDKLNRYSSGESNDEDYMDEFDLDMESKVSKSAKKLTKPKKQAISKSGTIKFDINKESLVQGIIMSEIINKRGGRRAIR